MDNSHQPVTIVVQPTEMVCGIDILTATETMKAVPVSGNLELAAEGDVDLGHSTGLPIRILLPSINTPAIHNPVDVRLRVESAALKAFDINIIFNTAFVHVHSCV